MIDTFRITAISENTVMGHSLLAQHGQSLLVEINSDKYIVDFSEIYEGLKYNLNSLGIDTKTLKAAILTHNHLDHSGALFRLVDSFTSQKLYLPPDMESMEDGKYNPQYRLYNEKQFSREEAIKKLLSYSSTVIVNEAMELAPNFYTTGPLSAAVQEQSLVVNVLGKGLVIIVGCSHPTLPVIIKKAREVTGEEKVYGLVGGFHYKDSNTEQINQAVGFIQDLNLEFIVPSHCTGFRAIQALENKMGEKVMISSTGQFGTGSSIQVLPDLIFKSK